MIHIDEFVKRVAPDALGCPATIVRDVTLDSIIKFCADTWVLQRALMYNISEVDINLNNSATVDLSDSLEETVRPVGLQKVRVGQIDYPVVYLKVINNVPEIKADRSKKFYYFDENYSLVIFPVTTGDMYIEVPITPLSTSRYLDPVLFDFWIDPIVAGAKQRLFRMPKKEWTDHGSASLMHTEYQRGVVMARRQVRKHLSNTSLEVNPRSDKFWF